MKLVVPLTMPEHPGDPVAGQRLAQRPDQRDRAGHRRPRSRGRRRRRRPPRAASAPSSASSALFAVTTDLPRFSAGSSSVRAGSMPPITSTTTSMSARSTSAVGVGGEQRRPARPGCRCGPAHRDPGQLERRADPGGEVVGLLVEQADHLRADDAAAQQRDPQRRRRTITPNTSQTTTDDAATSVGHDRAAALAGRRQQQDQHREHHDQPGAGLQPPGHQRHVQPQQVVLGLPAHDHPGLAVADRDHRRARQRGCSCSPSPAVRAGRGHREQVAGRQVGRQVAVPHHDVAALAVLADHPAQHRRQRREAREASATVYSASYSAVRMLSLIPPSTRDVRRAGRRRAHVLDGAHLVQGDRGRAGDRPARLDRRPRHGQPGAPALPADDLAQRLGHRVRRRRVVVGGVGDAEAAAEVERRRSVDAVLVARSRQQPDHPVRGDLEAGRCRRSASRCGECRPTSSSDGRSSTRRHRLGRLARRPARSRTSGPRARSR